MTSSFNGARAPRLMTVALNVLAATGGVIALTLGLVLLSVRLTPDTGHGEDTGGLIAFGVLSPILALAAVLAVGCGIGTLVISRAGARFWGIVGITSAVLGVLLAVVPVRS